MNNAGPELDPVWERCCLLQELQDIWEGPRSDPAQVVLDDENRPFVVVAGIATSEIHIGGKRTERHYAVELGRMSLSGLGAWQDVIIDGKARIIAYQVHEGLNQVTAANDAGARYLLQRTTFTADETQRAVGHLQHPSVEPTMQAMYKLLDRMRGRED